MIMSAPGLPDCAGVAQSEAVRAAVACSGNGGVLARENSQSSTNLKLLGFLRRGSSFRLGSGFAFGFSFGGAGLGFSLRRLGWLFVCRIEVEDASAGAAGDDLLIGTDVLPDLGAQHDEAGQA